MLKGTPVGEYDVLNDKPASKGERRESDYESMIENAKTKLAACDRFLDAVYNFIDALSKLTGSINSEEDMASELVDLVREKRVALENHIDSLIEEQKKAAR
jgi:hypothetical protein